MNAQKTITRNTLAKNLMLMLCLLQLFSCEMVDAYQYSPIVNITEYEVLATDTLGHKLIAVVKMKGTMPVIQFHVQKPDNSVFYMHRSAKITIQFESNYVGTFHQSIDADSTIYLQDHLVRDLERYTSSPIERILVQTKSVSIWMTPLEPKKLKELLSGL
tara:strand:- start:42920 stop:43399 length:480 start_codon:yes stop_codon:yes gene_type:complete